MPSQAVLKAKITLHDGEFTAGMRKAIGTARHAGQEIGHGLKEAITGPLAEIGLALAGAFTGEKFIEATKAAYELGGSLTDLNRRTGITAGQGLVLQQTFKDIGLGADAVGPAVNKMQKALAGANEDGYETSSVFSQIGLNMAALRSLDPAGQFEAVGKALGNIQDPARRTQEAMKIFGKSGGEMLAILNNPAAFGNAARALGQQAQILDKNAAAFKEISESLGHIGVKFQGFFVGFADSFQSAIKPLLDRMEKIDLAKMGERFGDGIKRGAAYFMAAFQNPALFGNALAANIIAGFKGAENYIVAAFVQSGNIFANSMAPAIQGIGHSLVATLMRAFQSPIIWWQAQIEAGLNKLRDGAKGIETSPVSDDDLKTIVRATGNIAGMEKTLKARAGHVPDSEQEPLKQEILRQIGIRGSLQTKVNNQEANAQLYDPRVIADRITREGVKIQTANGQSSAGQEDEAAKADFALSAKAMQKSLSEFTVKDLFGAKEAQAKADSLNSRMAALATAIQDNTKERADASTQVASALSTIIQSDTNTPFPWQHPATGPKGVVPTSLKPGIGIVPGQGLVLGDPHLLNTDQPPHPMSLLPLAERRAYENVYVAGGHTRAAHREGAYHAIRSGDHARAKAVAADKERQEANMTITDKKLGEIATILNGWNTGKK